MSDDRLLDRISRNDGQSHTFSVRDLMYLLPRDHIVIDEEPNSTNIRMGNILGALSGKNLEWYGYSLAERRDLGITVDTHIQEGQIASGVDVDMDAKDAKRAMEAINARNRDEGRIGTPQELVPVGIVHRHPGVTGIPVRSVHLDIPNFSRYLRWKAHATSALTDHLDSMDCFGVYDTELQGSMLVLVPKVEDHVHLAIDLSEIDTDNIIATLGPERYSVLETLDIGDILSAAMQSVNFIGQQPLHVAHASSIIYNDDGSQTYGELGVLAQGSVEGSYQDPIVVDVEVVQSGNGVHRTDDELEAEIMEKVTWAGKHVPVYVPGADVPRDVFWQDTERVIGSVGRKMWDRYWPPGEPLVLVPSSGTTAEHAKIDFFYAACAYMAKAGSADICYANYLFALFKEIEREPGTLAEAVEASPHLFYDPVLTDNQRMQIPVHTLRYDVFSKKLQVKDAPRDQDRLFMSRFAVGDVSTQNSYLESYALEIKPYSEGSAEGLA